MDSGDFNYFETMLNDSLFAVLDIETTGFSPKRGDKIVEIGIISIDLQGNVVDKYETLINPKREVSTSHVHKITAEMVKNAPAIEDVMGDIIYHINNKTIVGHNIAFDLRFISYELSKYLDRNCFLDGLCTMKLSRFIDPDLPARRLGSFCEYYDIEAPGSHSAIGDCESTMHLFNIFKATLIERMGVERFVQDFSNPVSIMETPSPRNICYRRRDAVTEIEKETHRLSHMINRLPGSPTDSLPVQQYLNLLDEILADRIITQSESEMLMDFLNVFSISQEQAIDIHSEYLRKLARVYLLDNYLSECECQDLSKVAALLCVEQDKLSQIIEFEKANIAKENLSSETCPAADYIGKSICFTGQLISKIAGRLIDRSFAQQMAMERGLVIKNGVSKNLDMLVVADPNSLSGKAQKARELGIKIIAEPVFWNMIGVSVE